MFMVFSILLSIHLTLTLKSVLTLYPKKMHHEKPSTAKSHGKNMFVMRESHLLLSKSYRGILGRLWCFRL